jgi:hypothetical protein
MTPREVAEEVLERVVRSEEVLRSNGYPVRVDGREWLELCGVTVRLSIPTVLYSEEEARDVAFELDRLSVRTPNLVDLFERESFDFRVHAAVLRREIEDADETTSRRLVSTVGPPRCPTAIQVLRDRPGGALEVVGFMRSERLVPILPLDLLNHLWVAGEAVGDGRATNLTLLIGSLHVEIADSASFLPR